MHTSRKGLRESLITALTLGQVTPRPPQKIWRFAPMPGASALFGSSPRAKALAHHIPGLTALGITTDGFAQFRLAL